jgi:hypothetical protein
MNPRAREIEFLALTMFAALPLYATQAISPAVVAVFHLLMAGILIRVALGGGPEIVPPAVLSIFAIAYFVFFFIDAFALSRNLIGASSHLILFIALYQPIEAQRVRNGGQRLLITFLIFVSSIATATDISIILFVIAFAFLAFRQMMYMSERASADSVGRADIDPPSNRAAAFYVCGTAAVALVLFPLLPRVRNPFVRGYAGALNNASTGLSESIDFNQERSISSDSQVVARVWMPRQFVPFFTPVRLKAYVYEVYQHNRWKQFSSAMRAVHSSPHGFAIGRPVGFRGYASVQQKMIAAGRLFLPEGTFNVRGIPHLYEGPGRDTYSMFTPGRDSTTIDVDMSRDVIPLRAEVPHPTGYPVGPKVAAMAHRIVGQSTAPLAQAAKIETYLRDRFIYVADPATLGRKGMTVDEFLLQVHRGHCEYFAAGMVALMTALDVPARIVGGFYGGQANPLTGYFAVRRQDAHAWVEIFDRGVWRTFDPTPPSLRPGNASEGLLRLYASALSDSMNYFWDRYILTFGLGDQIALITQFLESGRGTIDSMRHGMAAAARAFGSVERAVIGAIFLLTALAFFMASRRRRPLFVDFEAYFARAGIPLKPAMTLGEALEVLRDRKPEDAERLTALASLYEEEQFSARPSPEVRARIRKGLAELRR